MGEMPRVEDQVSRELGHVQVVFESGLVRLDAELQEAWECGVGSTWVRGFDERIMKRAFNLPPTWKVVAMMPMGYPAETAHPSNWHFARKSTEELYRFL